MGAEHQRRAIPDRGSSAQLDNGYMAAWCIAPDGEPWPWLVADLCPRCDTAATHGSRNDVPTHERTGRLPRTMREALGMVHHCGAPTRYGSPCRQVVREPGAQCGTHARKGGA